MTTRNHKSPELQQLLQKLKAEEASLITKGGSGMRDTLLQSLENLFDGEKSSQNKEPLQTQAPIQEALDYAKKYQEGGSFTYLRACREKLSRLM